MENKGVKYEYTDSMKKLQLSHICINNIPYVCAVLCEHYHH